MKKVFITAVSIVVIVFASYNIFIANMTNNISDKMLANIEALANGETSGYSCSTSANCYYGGRVEGTEGCTGTKECESGYNYVKCDGNKSKCKNYSSRML